MDYHFVAYTKLWARYFYFLRGYLLVLIFCFLASRDIIYFVHSEQTTSRRLADRKIARFEKNITKRGAVPETVKKGNDYPFGPILLGFFVFVVVGSCKSLCL